MPHLVSQRRSIADGEPVGGLVGASAAMSRLREQIEAIGRAEAPVLITGEAGTGKELVARALHAASGRRHGPFVILNCAAFTEDRLEAELLGDGRRPGCLEAARGGTLFLDEVADLPLGVQGRLVHVLEACSQPRESAEPPRYDVRVLSAAACDLKERVAAARFRQDLYYRLKVLVIAVPPLRDRLEDLPQLVEHFVRRFAGATPPRPTAAVLRALERYPFPGNVRELENVVRHGVALSRGGVLDLEHLPPEIVVNRAPGADRPVQIRPLVESVRAFERTQILDALRFTRGCRMEAAQTLHISRKCLWEKMKAYDIREEEFAD